jgi:NAD(P)-dependent dehydrogenase (short-subunit alcohol dehydrogenase family)
MAFEGDVRDEASVIVALDALVATGARLWGVVNAAGRHWEAESVSASLDEARSLLETNFFGTWSVCRLAHPRLVAAGGGVIINVGSFYDRLGVPRNLAYAASKAAIATLTRCLAVEWARDGIRVLNIAPGYVETELNAAFFADEAARARIEKRIPVRRIGQAEEVARMIGATLEDDVRFLTGETIYVDGGQGIAL